MHAKDGVPSLTTSAGPYAQGVSAAYAILTSSYLIVAIAGCAPSLCLCILE